VSWWNDHRARAGAIALALLALVAVVAPTIAPYSSRAQDRAAFLQPPELPRESCSLRWFVRDDGGRFHLFGFGACRVYLMGTDGVGRDVFSRLLLGARWSMAIAVLGVVLAVGFGTLVGATAGFHGGRVDRILMRATEVFMALPALYLVLGFRGLFPDALEPTQAFVMLVVSLAAVGWCGVARTVRAQVLALREREFVVSAAAAGAGGSRLLVRHILPNALPFIWLQAGLALPHFVVGEAALSFLGLGMPEPEPSWGNMLAGVAASYSAMTTYWWTLLAPASALTVAVLAANLWIEGMRRAYFPPSGPASKQRRQRAS
jgi:peptide/nickel transport system permease protein